MYKGEKLNSISHLVGASLALIGMVVLIVFAARTGNGWKLAGAITYGVCLFLMFLFSTLYHSLRGTPKHVFQRFDHIGIYLLIAGTYTPYCLVTLRDSAGPYILATVWSVAVFGIAFKGVFGARFNVVSTLLYVACGWTIALDFTTVLERFTGPGFYWLLGGGVLYTGGAFFFLKDSIPRNHEIWHFFVLAAAACHFVSVFFYVL